MNGENNHIFHTSALDGVTESSQARKFTPALITAQLWLFAAFGALSLVGIAVNAFVTGEQSLAVPVILGASGIVLFPVLLHNVARALERAEPNPEAAAPLAPELQFALHR
jgi:hypothetical protein